MVVWQIFYSFEICPVANRLWHVSPNTHGFDSPDPIRILWKKKKRKKEKKGQKTGRDQWRIKNAFYFPLYVFYFICNVKKKRIRISNFKILKLKKKKKNSNFENSKKKMWDILFNFIYMGRDRATKLRSRAKTISRSEPLSHWVAIRAIEPWSDQAKPSSKSPSQNPCHRASELRSEPSSRDTSQAELSQDIWAILL